MREQPLPMHPYGSARWAFGSTGRQKLIAYYAGQRMTDLNSHAARCNANARHRVRIIGPRLTGGHGLRTESCSGYALAICAVRKPWAGNLEQLPVAQPLSVSKTAEAAKPSCGSIKRIFIGSHWQIASRLSTIVSEFEIHSRSSRPLCPIVKCAIFRSRCMRRAARPA